jgi:hypothetical protein
MKQINLASNIQDQFKDNLACFNSLQSALGRTIRTSSFYLETKDGFIKSIQPIYPPPNRILIPVGVSIDTNISNKMFAPLHTNTKEFFLHRLLPNNEALYYEL